jgi:hypothetical protein
MLAQIPKFPRVLEKLRQKDGGQVGEGLGSDIFLSDAMGMP